jgi:hypothetical protein
MISQRDITFLTCLGHHGRLYTERTISILWCVSQGGQGKYSSDCCMSLTILHTNFANVNDPLSLIRKNTILWLDKNASWQSPGVPKCQGYNITRCQADNGANGQMSSWQNFKVTKWQVDKMSSWKTASRQNAKLPKRQVDPMSRWPNGIAPRWTRSQFSYALWFLLRSWRYTRDRRM